MNIRSIAVYTFLVTALVTLGCSGKKVTSERTAFTKTDSLTEVYLNLQDTMLLTWNMMIHDDNEKLKSMGSLLHELKVCGQFDQDKLKAIESRLNQLSRIRYTHKTMSNADVVEEYDFASSSVVSELVSLAEAHKGYSYNKALQGLVQSIENAEQRIAIYRSQYDMAAGQYNTFLEQNQSYLQDIVENGRLEKKPLFHMAAEAE